MNVTCITCGLELKVKEGLSAGIYACPQCQSMVKISYDPPAFEIQSPKLELKRLSPPAEEPKNPLSHVKYREWTCKKCGRHHKVKEDPKKTFYDCPPCARADTVMHMTPLVLFFGIPFLVSPLCFGISGVYQYGFSQEAWNYATSEAVKLADGWPTAIGFLSVIFLIGVTLLGEFLGLVWGFIGVPIGFIFRRFF